MPSLLSFCIMPLDFMDFDGNLEVDLFAFVSMLINFSSILFIFRVHAPRIHGFG